MVQQWAPSPEGCQVVVVVVVVTAARKVPVVVIVSWLVRLGVRVVLEQAGRAVQSMVVVVAVTAARKVPVVVIVSWLVRLGARVVLEQAGRAVQSVAVVGVTAVCIPWTSSTQWVLTSGGQMMLWRGEERCCPPHPRIPHLCPHPHQPVPLGRFQRCLLQTWGPQRPSQSAKRGTPPQ